VLLGDQTQAYLVMYHVVVRSGTESGLCWKWLVVVVIVERDEMHVFTHDTTEVWYKLKLFSVEWRMGYFVKTWKSWKSCGNVAKLSANSQHAMHYRLNDF
jgi:hypothetical protein